MAQRVIHLLHIEDDTFQQRLIAGYLCSMREVTFTLSHAAGEDAALVQFERGRPEIVILDYCLVQGDGLSCLRRLRRLDPFIPVVVVSGEATPSIAAELLRAGADDYLSKEDLTSALLIHSLREALARVDSWWRRSLNGNSAQTEPVESMLRELCSGFLTGPGGQVLNRLDELEALARAADLTPRQVERLFERIGAQLDTDAYPGSPPTQHVLRPLFLELVLRLFGSQYFRHLKGKFGQASGSARRTGPAALINPPRF